MGRLRRLIKWRRAEIYEVLGHALVLTRRHESRALRARLWRLQLRDASRQHLDLLVAVVLVGTYPRDRDETLAGAPGGWTPPRDLGDDQRDDLRQRVHGSGRAGCSRDRTPKDARPAALAPMRHWESTSGTATDLDPL